MKISIDLRDDMSVVLRDKMVELLSMSGSHNKVLQDTAQAVGNTITNYVPRSERPPSVHHLQDFEVSELGVVRWYGDHPPGHNYAQRVFYNREGHTFHVRYPGHTPQSHWLDILYDRGIMSQIENNVKVVLENAAHEL